MNVEKSQSRPASFRIVSGMHRSGTTFLGSLLGSLPNTAVIHEPFNLDYGAANARVVYPVIDTNPKAHQVPDTELLREVLDLRARPRRTATGDSFYKAILRRLTGGPFGVTQKKARISTLFSSDTNIFIKDPFLLLAAPYITQELRIPMLAVVRHPGAVWMSLRRMSWDYDVTKLATVEDRNDLFAEFGFSEQELKSATPITRFSALWAILNKRTFNQEHQCENLHITRHETLCLDPHGVIEGILNKLGLPDNDRVHETIDKLTAGDTITPDDEKIHHLARRSKSLPNAWRKSIEPAEEENIKRITLPVVKSIYGDW
jgi:hypothetical protein